jgi:cell division protease FtsH
LKKVPAADDVDPSVIARGTPGFSGADLANLVNEAALFAARGNKRLVAMKEMDLAKDKIMMGAERRSMVMNDKEKELTAYHEAGHAIVGRLVPAYDPVYKVSIIPRGRALGVTMFLPEQDKLSQSREELESGLSVLYGGRLAEEIIFGADAITTGASNDIQVATKQARNMVTMWGFSENMGPLSYVEDRENHKVISEDTAKQIDDEMRKLITRNYDRAEKMLNENLDKLHAMAKLLIKYETIDSDQIDAIMEGREPGEPRDWNERSDNTPPSSSAESEKTETSGKPADQLH